jgi:aldehyde:ferredoxin oxidoreductase
MYGSYGRVLCIDMSRPGYSIEPLAEEVWETYLGGKGLGSYLLWRHNPAGVDPLSPENRLIFTTGPVTGSQVWGSCRYGVFTKSPQTGCYSESYAGGRTPEAMEAAGFDAVMIHGRAEQPTILVVHPEGAEFHPAEEIWGLETYAAEDAVRRRFAPSGSDRKCGAVVIGPAGENLVRFALIENDYWRSAGRTGTGAVMGAKNLKAILFHGDRRRPLHDETAVRAMAKEMAAGAKESPVVLAYKSMGTPMMVDVMNAAQAFPTRYWSAGRCDHRESINAGALHKRCEVKPHACLKCFMACGRMSTVLEGRHAGLRLEGPEYETIYAFGGLCMVEEIEEIIFLNDLCDRLGLDTISAGNLCALAMEAASRGRLADPIKYGDVDGIADLLRAISRKEGVGAVLAEGIIHAARTWALEDLAVHVKGLEPAGYDPRVLKGMGLAYATSDRGACHLRTTFYKPELSGLIPPSQIEGKAALLIDYEDRLTLFDTLILCRFYRDLYDWPALGRLIQAATGLPADKAALQKRAASISDLVRHFNLREGLRREDDRLPHHLYRKMADSEHIITAGELDCLLRDYYRLRGWSAQGRPPTEVQV